MADFREITLTETYHNFDIIKTLCKVDTSHPEYDATNMMWKTEQAKCLAILKRATKIRTNKVNYKQAPYGVGRLWAKPYDASLQSMYKRIRRLVLNGQVTSVDVSNCEPTLLHELLGKYAHQNVPPLNKYVKNRESILQEVVKEYGVPKHKAKDLFISMTNGGGYKKWFKDNKLENAKPSTFIYTFHKEAQEVLNSIAPTWFPEFERYQEIAKESKMKKNGTTDNVEGSALALYLMDHERQVMGHLYEYLTNELGLKPSALIHDEWLVDGRVLDKIGTQAMSDYIKDKTGFILNFTAEIVEPTAEDKEWFEKHKAFITTKEEPATEDKEEEEGDDDGSSLYRGKLDELLSDTDYELAKIIHSKFKDKYVAVSVQKTRWEWYEFRDHRWNACPLGATLMTHMNKYLYACVCEHRTKLKQELIDTPPEFLEELLDKIGKLTKTANSVRKTARKKTLLEESALLFMNNDFLEKLDSKTNLLGFTNGVFDLDANEFRPGKPDDYITFSTKYDYHADVDPEIREEIMRFYESITPNKEELDYLLATQAYALHGNKFLEEFWIWEGSGGNGKGVDSTLLDKTFGEYYYEPDITILTQKAGDSSRCSPEQVKMYGKRLIVMTEPENSENLQANRLKKITGGDTITGRGLYQDTKEFKPQFALIVQSNGMPNLSQFDAAITRRLRIIKFMFKFVDNPNPENEYERAVDRTLKDKFESDVRYHQQLMLILIERFNRDVKDKNKLHTPERVMRITKDYLETQDTVRTFINEHYEITNNPKDRVQSSELFNHFKSTYGRDHSLVANKFKEQMLNIGGIEFKKTNKCQVFTMLKRRDEETVDDDEY